MCVCMCVYAFLIRNVSTVSFKGKGRFPFCDAYKAALTRPRFIEHAVGCPPNTVIMGYFVVFPFEVLINRLQQCLCKQSLNGLKCKQCHGIKRFPPFAIFFTNFFSNY